MYDFEKIKKKYQSDAAFNKMVNVFRELIEKYGFLPSEIREGIFFAQYVYEITNARAMIQTEEDFIKIELARLLLRETFSVKEVGEL